MRDSTNPAAREIASPSPDKGQGTITLISGCMFSGKTTELIRRLAALPRGLAVGFKHVIDQRYAEGAIVSHAGKALPALVVASASGIPERVELGIQVVGIDEAHFFDAALIEVTLGLAAAGTDVIITALDSDSWGRPFAVVEQLWARADEPVLKQAVCARCGNVADRTQRLTPIVNGRMVGGPGSYEPRCQRCWTPPPEPPPD